MHNGAGVSTTTSLITLLLVEILVFPTPYTKNYIVRYFVLLCNQGVQMIQASVCVCERLCKIEYKTKFSEWTC